MVNAYQSIYPKGGQFEKIAIFKLELLPLVKKG